MTTMYSEFLIAHLTELAADVTAPTGASIDQAIDRRLVTIGRVLGLDLGIPPTDTALAFVATRSGTPAPIGTRAAIHVLPDGRCAVGLGSGRGVIETNGERLVRLTHPEPGRYTGAWKLPNVLYGGLI